MLLSVPLELLPSSETGSVGFEHERVSALVDTGATVSAVRRDIARKLELPVIDQTLVETAAGTIETERVVAQILRPARGHRRDGTIPDHGSSPGTYRTVRPLAVFDGGDDFLLGMDLLEGGRLVVDLVRARWEWRLVKRPISDRSG